MQATYRGREDGLRNRILVLDAVPRSVMQRRELLLVQVIDVLRQFLLDVFLQVADHGDFAVTGKLN